MTAYTLFSLDSMESGAAQKVTIDDRDILLVRIDDDVYALSDTCSHADVSLSGGFVEADDCAVECPKHGASFDLRTGEALTLPAIRPVPTYEVAVVDGDVVLTLAPLEEDA
ncbi:MAG: non-heme iron oxygenase ferredoxin subunit [Actinomycetota bacterium]